MFVINSKVTKNHQKAMLPILLCLIPLIAVNFGYFFLSGIDMHWRNIEQIDMGNQEIEALSSSSDFSYQFANLGGEFRQTFVSAIKADLSATQLKNALQLKAKNIYRKPFPEYNLFAFHINEKKQHSKMILFDGKKALSKRAFSRVFTYLVNLNKGKNIRNFSKKQDQKLLSNLLGKETAGDVIANSQRAKTTYVLYKKLPSWLIWDYFTIPGKGTFGYIVISPLSAHNITDGQLLALRDFKNRRLGLAAFIPVFKDCGRPVLQSPLHKSRLFKNWIKNNIIPVEDDLNHWLKYGPPKVMYLGNFRVFSYLGKGQTHLSTLLLPKLPTEKMPIWLKILNCSALAIISLLLLRGFLRGQWIEVGLKSRFFITFLLASTLPLSLLAIASSGYISHFKRSIHFQTISNLLMCIKQFDARKTQLSSEYKAAFLKLVKDPKLSAALKKDGSSSIAAGKIVEAAFTTKKRTLPIMGFAIYDESSQGIRSFEISTKEEMGTYFDSASYPIVSWLRQHLKRTQKVKLKSYTPTNSQKLIAQAYASTSGEDLAFVAGARRSRLITLQRKGSVCTQIHEYIKIDGVEKYALIVAWEDSALDMQLFRHTSNFLALNKPEYTFVKFRITHHGLKVDDTLDRHIPRKALSEIKKLAKEVSLRGSYAYGRFGNYSLVAYPSIKYSNSIIVGISDNLLLTESIFYRTHIFFFILLVSVLIILVCAHYAAKVILNPISSLKSSIDQVSKGNLDTTIISTGQDELGSLSVEFSNMTKGLRDRKRMAALVSDHAIEALSKSKTVDGNLAGHSFDGVALVSDIRNFTGMCEEFSPDKITELLNEHLARMTTIISEKGGRIYKFIGDAIEAVFPIDEHLVESPETRALQAAILINSELANINQNRISKGLFPYKIGIGLAFGRFFSGAIGSVDTRLDYAILGAPLKRAAELEALSKINPAIPIIVDAKVVASVVDNLVIFSKIDSEKEAFQISEMQESKIPNRESIVDITSSDSNNKNTPNDKETISHEKLPIKLIVSICFGLILLLSFGVYLGLNFRDNTSYDKEKTKLTEKNIRLIDQLKSENVGHVGFESICSHSVKKIENSLSFINKNNDNATIAKLMAQEIKRLGKMNVNISKAIGISFGNLNDAAPTIASTEIAFNKDWHPSQQKTLVDYAIYKYCIDQKINCISLRPKTEKGIKKLLGEEIALNIMVYDNIARAIDVNIEGELETLYLRYLIAYSDGIQKLDFSTNASLLRKNDPNLYRIVGMIMLTVPTEKLSQPSYIVSSYSQNKQALALVGDNKKVFCSPDFPEDVKNILDFSRNLQSKSEWLINQDHITLNETNYQVSVCSKFSRNTLFQKGLMISLIFSLAMLAFWYAYSTFCGKTFINRSLSAKLWLATLLCSIFPVVTMFFVIDLFSTENQNARIFQEKAGLLRFLDSFELRPTFAEHLVWKVLENFSYSKELEKEVANIDSQTEQKKDYSRLNNLFNCWHEKMDNLKSTVTEFYYRDTALVSKENWEFLKTGKVITKNVSGIIRKKNSRFGMILAEIGKNLIKKTGKYKASKDYNSEGLKGEMAIEAVLQTVRSVFGENAEIKIANGIGLPVKMLVRNSTVCMIIHPVASIIDPKYVVISMFLLKNGRFLGNIAAMNESKYAIFPTARNRYGQMANPGEMLFDLGLEEHMAWVWSSDLPISGEKKIAGQNLIYESRRGTQQTNMVITGIRPLTHTLKAVAKTERSFFIGLTLSILIILLIAKNFSAQIITPVQLLTKGMRKISNEKFSHRIGINRKDELGDLCNAFDKMARGIEEKNLIQKMLSQNAIDASLGDASSKREEVVVMYVGSPSFSDMITFSNHNKLFTNLQKHITGITRIILDEGGDIDKIIGEKILAVFHGKAQETAIMACKAGQRIMSSEKEGLLPFPIAGGINKGIVISGILGVGNKKDFTIIGDTVNIAARIAGEAEKMNSQRMLISEVVEVCLDSKITSHEFGIVSLKGKSIPIKVYRLDV